MRSRLIISTVACMALMLVAAPAALAFNDGRGWYGETNDKGVTHTGFLLIIFFPLFVLTMSLIQRGLDRRKESRKAASTMLASASERWRGGW